MIVETRIESVLRCCSEIRLIATPTRLYLVGKEPPAAESSVCAPASAVGVGAAVPERRYRILEFDRTVSAPAALAEIVFEHDRSYSQDDADALLRSLVASSASTGGQGGASTSGTAAAAGMSLFGDTNASGVTSQGSVVILEAVALLGAVVFTRGYHLVVVTKAQEVGTVGGHRIWAPRATELVPISADSGLGRLAASPAAAMLSSLGGKLQEALQERLSGLGALGLQDAANMAESRYQSLFLSIDLTREFFFSLSYDMTRPLQQQIVTRVVTEEDGASASTGPSTTPPQPEAGQASASSAMSPTVTGPTDMFTWNAFLRSELLHPVTGPCVSELTGVALSPWWTTPIVHGYWRQLAVHILGAPVLVSLLARRSRHYAGTRYLKRGADPRGHVANEVETEQIVEDVSCGRSGVGLGRHGAGGRAWRQSRFSSFVHMRGSIPCYWTQRTSVAMPKPPIVLQPRDPLHGPARRHFADLLRRYGGSVMCLNLVKKKEKGTPREKLLGREMARMIAALNRELPPAVRLPQSGQPHGDLADLIGVDDHSAELLAARIQYLALDYAAIVKSPKHNVLAVLRDAGRWALSTTGFFASAALPAALEERRARVRAEAASMRPKRALGHGQTDEEKPVSVVVLPHGGASIPGPTDAVYSTARHVSTPHRLTVDGQPQGVGHAVSTTAAALISAAVGAHAAVQAAAGPAIRSAIRGAAWGQPAATDASGAAAAATPAPSQSYMASLAAVLSTPAVMVVDAASVQAKDVQGMGSVSIVASQAAGEGAKGSGGRVGASPSTPGRPGKDRKDDKNAVVDITSPAPHTGPALPGMRFIHAPVAAAAAAGASGSTGHGTPNDPASSSGGPVARPVDWDAEPAHGPLETFSPAVKAHSDGPDGENKPSAGGLGASSGPASEDPGDDQRARGEEDPVTHADDSGPYSGLAPITNAARDDASDSSSTGRGSSQLGGLTPMTPASGLDDSSVEALQQQRQAAAVAAATADDDDDDDDEEDGVTTDVESTGRRSRRTSTVAAGGMGRELQSPMVAGATTAASTPVVTPAAAPPAPAQSTPKPASSGLGLLSRAFGIKPSSNHSSKAEGTSGTSLGSPEGAGTSSMAASVSSSSLAASFNPDSIVTTFANTYVELVSTAVSTVSKTVAGAKDTMSSSGKDKEGQVDRDADGISSAAVVVDPDPFPEDHLSTSQPALRLPGDTQAGAALHCRTRVEGAEAAGKARHVVACTEAQDAVIKDDTTGHGASAASLLSAAVDPLFGGPAKGGRHRAGIAARIREYSAIAGEGEYMFVDLLPAAYQREGETSTGTGGALGAHGATSASTATSSEVAPKPPVLPAPQMQRGVLRTNCVDCLDRTNVAQLTVGLYALGAQLASLGLTDSPSSLEPGSPFVRALMDMYTEHGDAIAMQYGGSEANKKVTATAHADGIAHQEATGAERGDRKDDKAGGSGAGSSGWSGFSFFGSSTSGAAVAQAQASLTSTVGKLRLASSGPGEILTSLQRYYSNSFTDSLKQAAINLFLGTYQHRVHGPGGSLAAHAVLQVGSQSSAGLALAATYGLHLWEMESDWPLHATMPASHDDIETLVPGEVLTGPGKGDWWTAPLLAYHRRGYPKLITVAGPQPDSVVDEDDDTTTEQQHVLTRFDEYTTYTPAGGTLLVPAKLPPASMPVAGAASASGAAAGLTSPTGTGKGGRPPLAPAGTASAGTDSAASSKAGSASGIVSSSFRPGRSGEGSSTPGSRSRSGSRTREGEDGQVASTGAGTSATPPRSSKPRLFDDKFGLSLFADVLTPSQLEDIATRLTDSGRGAAQSAVTAAKAAASKAMDKADGALAAARTSAGKAATSAEGAVKSAVQATLASVQAAQGRAGAAVQEVLGAKGACTPKPSVGASEATADSPATVSAPSVNDGTLASRLDLAPGLLSPLRSSASSKSGGGKEATPASAAASAPAAASSTPAPAPVIQGYSRETWAGEQPTVTLDEGDARLYDKYVALAGLVAGGGNAGQATGGAATAQKTSGPARVHVLTERSEIDRFRRSLAVMQPAGMAAPGTAAAPAVAIEPGNIPPGQPMVQAALEAVGAPAGGDVWPWDPSGIITTGPFAGQPQHRLAGPLVRGILAKDESARGAEYKEYVEQGSDKGGAGLRGPVQPVHALVITPTVSQAPGAGGEAGGSATANP